jgi:hypothetical protein
MSAPEVSPEHFADAMQCEMQKYLQSVMKAVNEAPDGQWLAASEEPVRELSADFRRQVYEKAVQMRVNAAEAAFPPSAQPDDGQTSGE